MMTDIFARKPPRRPAARRLACGFLLLSVLGLLAARPLAAAGIDFNRDIRPILAGACFVCHGPDEEERKANLRLDTREGATADLDGVRAIVPGDPAASELVRRITSERPSRRMPPAKSGKELSQSQIRRLVEWIEQGAPYAEHWAYVPPVRPLLPQVRDPAWPRNPIDRFILERLEREGLRPSPEADRYTLIRRASLDITGLPPALQEVEEFINAAGPSAYEDLVDRLLAKPAYGEHWARLWLDLARYADSAGYADDPPRTIWAYRDYVIDAFNSGKPFDRFTLEQIAGDLLPEPRDEALVATAFHRNTQTNNEGGTSDEEFRNVAVTDRVNTTLAVWMGTTMACAQCHNHKYDPISQEEYFRFFAFFNNTEDADRTDESPVLPLYGEEQRRRRAEAEAEAAALEAKLRAPTPELLRSQERWESQIAGELPWEVLAPESMESAGGATMRLLDDGSVLVDGGPKTDTYRLLLALPEGALTGIRLETLPHASLPGGGPGHGAGNFVVTRILASILPPRAERLAARYVRVEIPGKQKILSLAEVQVFARDENVALAGEARQESTDFDGPARLAIDGNTDGRYAEARSTTHTAISDDPWWEVDLGSEQPIDRIVIWNRTDNALEGRLSDFRLIALDGQRRPRWEQSVAEPPRPSAAFEPGGARELPLAAVHASHSQAGFDPEGVLGGKESKKRGWAIGGGQGKAHALVLFPAAPAEAPAGSTLALAIEQLSEHERHTLGRLRLAVTVDPRALELSRLPRRIASLLEKALPARTEGELAELRAFYIEHLAPELEDERRRLAALKKELAEVKPRTTVPILRELPAKARRKTRIQHRGNFLDLGAEVGEGVPAVFHPLAEGRAPGRLALARWLVDERNPLTARVAANRYWEKLFGAGIVATSEEFGAQGELPSHPELLDWLATELVARGWDLKELLRLLVSSATYRQSSRVTAELLERDPDNRLLSRAPRLRLAAEAVRDQALFAAGLLSPKMHGPPVRPPQPAMGLSAAFGGGIDWQPSEGEDRYRRGLYTTWRRSNPYPSMATFDAPNREVCTVRRARTNTPLQALVTLNDPVYVEAAQALARRMAAVEGAPAEKARYGFRLVLARPPAEEELERLVALHDEIRLELAAEPEKAVKLATVPVGPLPEGADAADLAAWTVVGNVLLNLDETLMKR
jgi:hypothetical protein